MDPDLVFLCFLLGAGALGIGVAGVIYLIRAYSRMMLNSVVQISPVQVKRGQQLQINISVCPRLSLYLDMIEITIACERTSRERSGGYSGRKYTTGSKDTVTKETTFIPVYTQLTPGEQKSYSASITVPGDGLPTDRSKLTWDSPQNISIEWFVTVRFNIAGFPDAIHKENIFVEKGF